MYKSPSKWAWLITLCELAMDNGILSNYLSYLKEYINVITLFGFPFHALLTVEGHVPHRDPGVQNEKSHQGQLSQGQCIRLELT